MKFVIYIHGNAGLGNRLHLLISNMRLAIDYYNLDYIVDWTAKKYKFCEIFDITELSINGVNCQIDESVSHDIFSESNFFSPNKNDVQRSKQIIRKGQIVYGYNIGFPILESELHMLENITNYKECRNTLSYLYDKTPEHFKNIYLQFFRKLKPSANINKIINDFIDNNFNKNMIGIHIRLGDKVVNQTKKENILRMYIKYISDEMINDQLRFFVSCDENSAEIYLKSKFGDKVIYYPHDYDNTQSDDITAFICMYLLSKCDKIVCMYGSTFSEIAWWLGGCKDIIILP